MIVSENSLAQCYKGPLSSGSIRNAPLRQNAQLDASFVCSAERFASTMWVVDNKKAGSCLQAWWICSHFPSVVMNNNRPPWYNFLDFIPLPQHTHCISASPANITKKMRTCLLQVICEMSQFNIWGQRFALATKQHLVKVVIYWHKAKHQEAQSITSQGCFCSRGWGDETVISFQSFLLRLA